MPMLETTYRHQHFTRELMKRDMDFPGGPRPGDDFSDFELTSLDGGMIRKQELRGRPVLLTFGSRTCPMTAAATPILKRLYDEFGRRVQFVTAYIKEAHPGDLVPQPETMDEKISNARRLQQRDDIPWPIGVDAIDGELHQQLGSHPNSAYILDESGRVAYRVLWSNDERGLRRGIEAVINGAEPGESRSRLVPLLSGLGAMKETLAEAGPAAERDVLRQAPPMYGLSRVAGVFRPLSPLGRGIAAVSVVGLALAAVIGGVAGSRGRRDRRG